MLANTITTPSVVNCLGGMGNWGLEDPHQDCQWRLASGKAKLQEHPEACNPAGVMNLEPWTQFLVRGHTGHEQSQYIEHDSMNQQILTLGQMYDIVCQRLIYSRSRLTRSTLQSLINSCWKTFDYKRAW